MLEEKMNLLKRKLIEEATLAENMVKKSIKGLVDKDALILKEVIEKDEPLMNKSEIEIEEMAINMIALYHPKATDLRTIVMVLKMNNDIERIGDLAVNISQSSLFLIERPQVKPLIDIPRMAEKSVEMLVGAIYSFINKDVELAEKVLKEDSVVDSLRDQVLRELITFMAADPSTIERSIHLIRISRALERIADLATNICEDTIFIIEGKIIKHGNR